MIPLLSSKMLWSGSWTFKFYVKGGDIHDKSFFLNLHYMFSQMEDKVLNFIQIHSHPLNGLEFKVMNLEIFH